MLKEISNDIRSAFQSNQNGITQLLVINIVLFLIVGTSKVLHFMAGVPSLEYFFLEYLGLSANPMEFVFRPWTLLTYSIVHLDIQHILFNMLFLYWFGGILQDFLGPKKILYFYLAGAISGGLLYILLFNLMGDKGMSLFSSQLIGASGAIYAIICGAAFLVPNYTMNLLFFGPVRLKYIAVFAVLISFLNIPNGNTGGNIAHLGGALGGILYLKYLQGALFRLPVRKSKPSLKGKVVRLESSRTRMNEQDELDDLLDKISEKGIQSLNKEERQRLELLSKPTNTNE